MFTERGDSITGIKRRCHDLSSNGVRNLATESGCGQLKEDLESSTCLAWMSLLDLCEVYLPRPITRNLSMSLNTVVMAIFVILVLSYSSEESVGISTGQVILFGTIPTTISDTTPFVIPPTTHIDTTPIPTVSPTIPLSPDYTPASPDYSPASDMEFDLSEDPLLDHIPPLPATSPFLSSTNDSLDSDTPDTPPSPTHGTPFTETTIFTQISPIASGAL
ncbi:hypothetical protein Tco_0118091 [Tanacetum coccineum]